MRDIKFRAWDKFSEKWLDLEEYVIDPEDGAVGEVSLYEIVDVNYDAILEQYTGLKDKNGVQIYENDLIKAKNTLYKVEWFNTSFWVIPEDEHGSSQPISHLYEYGEEKIYKLEVVGNIHENVDLLEEK